MAGAGHAALRVGGRSGLPGGPVRQCQTLRRTAARRPAGRRIRRRVLPRHRYGVSPRGAHLDSLFLRRAARHHSGELPRHPQCAGGGAPGRRAPAGAYLDQRSVRHRRRRADGRTPSPQGPVALCRIEDRCRQDRRELLLRLRHPLRHRPALQHLRASRRAPSYPGSSSK